MRGASLIRHSRLISEFTLESSLKKTRDCQNTERKRRKTIKRILKPHGFIPGYMHLVVLT